MKKQKIRIINYIEELKKEKEHNNINRMRGKREGQRSEAHKNQTAKRKTKYGLTCYVGGGGRSVGSDLRIWQRTAESPGARVGTRRQQRRITPKCSAPIRSTPHPRALSHRRKHGIDSHHIRREGGRMCGTIACAIRLARPCIALAGPTRLAADASTVSMHCQAPLPWKVGMHIGKKGQAPLRNMHLLLETLY